MRTLHIVVTILIVLLGCVHIGFTFLNFYGISMDAAWFVGTGLAIVLAGFLNAAMLRDRGQDTLIWAMTLTTNIIFTLGFGFALFMLFQPQVFIGLVLFVCSTIYSLFIQAPSEATKSHHG